MQFNPDDYEKLWLQTLLFKKNNRITILQSNHDKELLKYIVNSSNLCYTLVFASPFYTIDNQTFEKYDDVLTYMWSTISK
jgi:hypothetical protein